MRRLVALLLLAAAPLGAAALLADSPAHRKLIEEGRAPIAFLDYDWSLNDAGR